MSRKKAPVISDDDIDRFKSVNPLKRLEARLRRNENNRAAEKLTTTYLTFEVFEAWIAATQKGHTEEELRAIWMPEWGDESLTLPRALIASIVSISRRLRAMNSGTGNALYAEMVCLSGYTG